jgi:hypothetical protein
MTAYRSLVERVLAVKHAGIELGLSKAREQEAFVAAVVQKLARTSWPHRMTMTHDFDVVFKLERGLVGYEHQLAALRQHLAGQFEVCTHLGRLIVADRHNPALSCELVIGGAA